MNFTPEQAQAWKPKFNKAIIIISRRIISILTNILPILYSPKRNQEIFAEQNAAIGDSDFSDTFDTLESTFEYLNPILFSIFKCQVLRQAIAKYAPHTYNDPNTTPTTTILLLQDDEIPRLIAFGAHGNCINSVFDALNINYQDKNIDIIPFEYFSLHYVIILKQKNYREVYIKYEDLLIDNQPLLFRMIMDFIKLTVKILNFTQSAFVNPEVVSTGSCSHTCHFVQQNNVDPQPTFPGPATNSQGESSSIQSRTVTTVHMSFQQRSTVYSYRQIIDIMRNTRNARYRRFYL